MGVRKKLRVVSWNVNGIRAAERKGFLDWLKTSRAQIVGVQEVRARSEQLSPELRSPKRWHACFSSAERAGYSGVGLYSRDAPDSVETSLGKKEFDVEGRVQLARFGRLLIANVYFPNGGGKNRDNGRVPYKIRFYKRLYTILEEGKQRGDPILVMGDFNTAHHDHDLARPKQNRKTSGFLPEECREVTRWISGDWVDTFRHFQPEATGAYSWWSQRFGVRAKNVGWRIDMALASPGAMPYLKAAKIHPDVMGSDHCPISVDLDGAIL